MSVREILLNGKIAREYLDSDNLPNLDIDQINGLQSNLNLLQSDIDDINNSVGQPNGICPLNALGQVDPLYLAINGSTNIDVVQNLGQFTISTKDDVTFNTVNVTNKTTTQTNLEIYSRTVLKNLEKIDGLKFKTRYLNDRYRGDFNIYVDPINFFVGLGTQVVWAFSQIYNPAEEIVKTYDLTNLIQNISTGYLYVYPEDNSGNVTTLECNIYKLKSVSYPMSSGYMEWNVDIIQESHIYTSSERLSIILQPDFSIPHIADINNPHQVTQTQIGLSNVPNLKQNLIATTDPTVNDDSSLGYAVGSKWINTTLNRVWFASNVSIGAAVWGRGVSTLEALNDVDLITVAPEATNGLIYDGAGFWRPQPTTSQEDVSSTVLFDAPMNTDSNDVSSYASIGTINGTLSLVSAHLGNGYQNTSNGNYINYGFLPRLNFGTEDSWTMCWWMNSSDTSISTRIIASVAESVNGSGWQITGQGSNHRIEIQLSDINTTHNCDVRWEFLSGLYDGNWHFISLVHRTENGWLPSSLDLYLDGELRNDVKSTITNNLLQTDDIKVVSAPFCLFSRNGSEGSQFQGILDNFQIYNFSFFGQYPVRSLYNNGVGKQNPDYTITTMLIHDHPISQIRNLQTELDNLQNQITSNDGDITTLQTNKVENATNTGIGAGLIFKDKTTTNLNFKSLIAGTGIGITNNTDDITISATNPDTATATGTTTTNFNNRLSIADTNVQLALDTLDNFQETDQTVTNTNGTRNYALGIDIKTAIDALDNQTHTITTDFTNHVNGTASNHDFVDILNAITTRNYANGANLELTTNELDDQIKLNADEILKIGRPTLDKSFLQAYLYQTKLAPTSVTFNSFGSMTFDFTSSATIWERLISIFPNIPQKPIRQNGTPRSLYFVWQKIGSAWDSLQLGYTWQGFCNINTFDHPYDMLDYSTVALCFNGIYDTNESFHNIKCRWIRFYESHGIEVNTGDRTSVGTLSATPATTTQDSTDLVSRNGDILICWYNADNNRITFETRDGTNPNTVLYAGYYTGDVAYDTTSLTNQYVIPIISCGPAGANCQYKVLSQRECDNIGLVVSDAQNFFY